MPHNCVMNLEVPFYLENYIGGYFIGPLSGQYLAGINPATGEQYYQVPDSNEKDIELAVNAAHKAFPEWSSTASEKKFIILNRVAELIDAHLDELALAETNDNGKPLWLSKTVDIPRASSNFRFFATAQMHYASESHQMEKDAVNYTLRQPIGIVGCISPWNLPLYLFTWKIAPALAAGNCVVAKPSEVTPVTAFLLSKICKEAGLPDGVLNIVHGAGNSTGEAIIKHPDIKAISFTGSTKAGSRIASLASPVFKKLSLELGGKNPTIVFADCDWELTLKEVMRASFANQGQICLCGSRVLIEASIYEKFKAGLIEKTRQLSVGDPLEAHTKQGAIVSQIHYQKILNCIETAKQEGGNILVGGNAIQEEGRCKNGLFISPTIIENLGPNCITNQEEIFGPVITLQPFNNIEEALSLANATQYGLAASVFTTNLSTAHQVAAKLQCGIVWINCWLMRDLRTPFGGVKNSGLGREGGWEALRFFTESKNVCIRYNN